MTDEIVISTDGLTKDYGFGRGIFDVSLNVRRGEMLGFAGTNGSGKTTTIRNIMGFLKPTRGRATVLGMESWSHSSEIVKHIGYVPGEIAFPDLSTGVDFLKSQAEFLGVTDMSRAESVIERLQLDPRAPLKRMSKGMKQKTAIVAALMADPEIIILDEPTTGLDPLMRDAFLDIIRAEHRVALIHNGQIADIAVMSDITDRPDKEFKIEFNRERDYAEFKTKGFTVVRDQPQYLQVTVLLPRDRITELFGCLKGFDVKFITEVSYDLEKHFKTVLEKVKENKTDVQ